MLWFREEGEISSQRCQQVFWLHWEAVRISGLDFMWVLNKVLALSRVLQKLAASFNHLQIPWVHRQHWYFVSPCRLVVRLLVAGAGCILPSVEASFSFLTAGWYLPRWFPQKIRAAASLEICYCVGALLFPVDLMSGAGSILLTFFTVNNFNEMVILVGMGVFAI